MRRNFLSLGIFAGLLISSSTVFAASLKLTLNPVGASNPALNLVAFHDELVKQPWSQALPNPLTPGNSPYTAVMTGFPDPNVFLFEATYNLAENGTPIGNIGIFMNGSGCNLTADTPPQMKYGPYTYNIGPIQYNGSGTNGNCELTITVTEVGASTLDLAVSSSEGSQANLSAGTITENNNAQFTPGLPSDVATNGTASTKVIGINPPETFSFKATYKLMEGANLVSDNISFTMSENGCSLLTPSRIDYQQQYTYEISATDNCKVMVNAVAYAGDIPITEAIVTIRNQISRAK